jgi:AraC-like DNA-binding protein
MRMIAPFEVLLIIGITQGFVIAGLIWLNKKRSVSKLLLSLVLTVFNLLCIRIIILTGGLWQTQFFRYLPLAFDLAMQPLIWLYILSLTKPGFKLSKVHLIHFIPFAISIAYSSFVYIAVIPQKELVAKDVIANSFYFNNVKETEDFLSVISAIIYWWLGLRLVMRYRSWLYNNISNTDYPTYKWLKNVTLLMGILITGLTIDIILDYFFHFGTRYFLHWQVFFIYLAVLIYYLGFRGYQLHDKQIVVAKNEYRQEEVAFQDRYLETSIDKALPETFEVSATHTDEEIQLSDEKNQQVKEAIIKALEINELYLDPELNLNKLSKEIHLRPVIVSAVINSSFQMSFRNLINEYRVNKVKERFKDPASKQLSILGIAYECGFNSEASFYRIFKAEVGITPKEYIKRLQSST